MTPPSVLVPRCEINIRAGTLADVPFMDALQKKHGKALGYFPTKQFEGYVEMGGVLIAEEGSRPIGYCLSRDRYLKRDELGIVYQLCVEAGLQRKLVGAALVREVFARSAYGCKLYCCWCAQDLEANQFWESMGFIPIAFRAGSEKKQRVQIFWQRRIVEGDTTTPYWFPSQTNQGAMREDRIVLPIPPGLSWRDEMPVFLPKHAPAPEKQKRIESSKRNATPQPRTPSRSGGVQFGRPPAGMTQQPETVAVTVGKPARPKREKKPKVKIDPQVVDKARELRDKYLEQFNSGVMQGAQGAAALTAGKYQVARSPNADRQLPNEKSPRMLAA